MNPNDEQRPEFDPRDPTSPEPPAAAASDPAPWWSGSVPASDQVGSDSANSPWLPPTPAAFETAPRPEVEPSAVESNADDPALPEKKLARKRFRRTTAATVAAVVVSAAVTGTVVHAVDGSHASTTAATSVTSTSNLPSAAAVSSSVKSALAKIEPSVVIINDTVTASPNGRGGGFGGFGGFEESGAGTGIIITADGEVVTNAHVVNGASNIKVTLPNNGGTHDASVVGIDTSKDLAVIKISGVSGLTPATFANSDTVAVGDSVIAVGNALGYGGSPTVTEGIVSAKGRSLQDSEDNLTGLLQTDAAINPGNSGGPLVDENGDVIGINVAVATGSSSEPAQNIGFTIPSNTVVGDLPSLKAGKTSNGNSGTQSATYLGVQVTDAQNGAGIVAVQPSSPAATAGLQSGDVITKFDSTTITDGTDLQNAVRGQKPGTTVTLTVDRNGQTLTLKATLGSTQLSS
ncbi:MAG: S1C family serine protease [Acidothermaceae bacterium]